MPILIEGDGLPILSWCLDVEAQAMEQARNLARHPACAFRVALMPDCHFGFGMPIGAVIACRDALIPNAVGVDIGCGMAAVKTDVRAESLGLRELRAVLDAVKLRIPVGEGRARAKAVHWEGFEAWDDGLSGSIRPPWHSACARDLDERNLGTLGGGNHFIELQKDGEGFLHLMLHSGSRNLGSRIATYFHRAAAELDGRLGLALPHPSLAYLPTESGEGRAYVRDMGFAMRYAEENRRRMMESAKEAIAEVLGEVAFGTTTAIHHNYASLEELEDGHSYWIHRKGATSARAGEPGIIPGSMGTASYLVTGRGEKESFSSCSHGAGRRMGRNDACRRLDVAECDAAMGAVVHDRWKTARGKGRKGGKLLDLSEAPPAYKDIDEVIEAELDLVIPLIRLQPLGVIKG
ncbi:MAG: hypothetical protein A2Z99_14995 [Treponema sp. GWB1_62_6]|nr:MAG: hypothetical protein A2Z99_14995 [Treponema sp. GWB1_62_6]OHE69443.1 MAG: hypothetical protein A2001_18830 [Treponema sp. GWC1_61_84]HCM25166.1 RtcB family protein [Treponema sp.]